MSDSDQNTNAITEEERKQQLAKLNLNVDESITAVDDEVPKVNGVTDNKTESQSTEVINSNIEKGDTQAQSNSEQHEQTVNNDSVNSSNVSDNIQSKDVPNGVLEEIVDDISDGIVKDFSKNIATYVTEVCKFDQNYEKDQAKDTEETQDNSTNSGSENSEQSSEVQTEEQSNEQLEQNSEFITKEVDEGETTPINPDNVKENDVKDECIMEEKKENKDADEGDEDGYLDLLGNGLLKRKVLEGKDVEDIKPYHGEMVTVNTSGKLEDGTIVDEFTNNTFAVGEGDVIQAWDLGIMTTKVGQTIELITNAKYAYGELGRKPDIPSNATITYTIKLIKKEDAPDLNKLDADQRLTLSEQKRERGNALFARNDYPGAINSYNKAIKILESALLQGSPEKLQNLADCRLKCYNNMAACQLKVEAFDAAVKSCQCVLDLQPENVKALFRLGKAYTAKGESKSGIQYLQKALKLEPDSKVIKQEIRKLMQKISKETELEKDMYKKMMGTKTVPVETSNAQQKSWKWAFIGGGVAALVAAGLAAYRYGHH